MNKWLSHNLAQRTKDNKLPFEIEFNFKPFSPLSFREESEKVCEDLYDKYKDNLFLAFSGGSDSEYILNTFLKLGIPITPVIVSCPFNQTDITPAFSYCKNKGIVPVILTYGNEYLKISKDKIYDRGLLSPIGLTPLLVYDHVKDLGGKVISGQGEPLPITNKGIFTNISSKIQMYEFEFYMDIYAEDQPPPFYCYNQNIFYSYIKEIDKSLDLQHAKCVLYDIPIRKKTYWLEDMYRSIRDNKVMEYGYYTEYCVSTIQQQLESLIIK